MVIEDKNPTLALEKIKRIETDLDLNILAKKIVSKKAINSLDKDSVVALEELSALEVFKKRLQQEDIEDDNATLIRLH